MAIRENNTNTRKDNILLWCHGPPIYRLNVWSISPVRGLDQRVELCTDLTLQIYSCRVYAARGISPSRTSLLLQETVMALFPVRPLLLLHDPQLRVHMDPAVQSRAIRCLLLSVPWCPSQCRHHLEK